MKSINIQIPKNISPVNFDEIINLYDQLDKSLTPLISTRTIQSVLDNPRTQLITAVRNQEIIGMITLCTYPQIIGSRNAWIEDFVVDENCRKKGIGTKLLLHTHEIAREMNCQQVVLTSNPKRVVANKYYKKIGYKKRDTNVFKFEL